MSTSAFSLSLGFLISQGLYLLQSSFSDQRTCKGPSCCSSDSLPNTKNSICALAFPIPSQPMLVTSLHSPQDARPWFCCLWISFLHFSSTRRSFLSCAGLLPSLPDFLHMGTKRSCAVGKSPLNSCQLLYSSGEFHRGFHPNPGINKKMRPNRSV